MQSARRAGEDVRLPEGTFRERFCALRQTTDADDMAIAADCVVVAERMPSAEWRGPGKAEAAI